MTDAASPAPPLPRIDTTRDTEGLVILRASRLEALLDPFRDLLAATWPDNPLQPQTVIAAHPGIKQWLTGALARRMGQGGIVANLEVVLPSTWIDRLAQARLGEQAVALPRYQRAQLRWNLHEWLGDAAAVPGLDDPRIVRFLEPGQGDAAERARRRYQLADRLAKLYSQYLVYRPDWLAAWQAGKLRFATAKGDDAALADTEARLLAPLWRHAAQALGPHRAEVMDALIDGLQRDDAPRTPLHVFGVSHLAPRELEALRVYAERTLVALYLPDPCRDYWGVLDHAGASAPAWRAQEARLLESAGEGEWWHPQRHELLSRWGRMGQHFFSAVAEAGVREDIRHGADLDDAVPANRLQRVQASIRRLDESVMRPPANIDAELADASLRVHACHTPKRELEVLRDAMLDARAAGIAPGEMLVMAPDIRRYLPLIPAVFGEPGSARSVLPYHLADVPIASRHPLFAAFTRLLQLAGARVTAPEIVDLMAMPEIARRFGLSAAAFDALQGLLADSRVAWSLDPAHRATFGVPEVAEHGFAWALDRMVAGHLYVDDAEDAAHALHLPDGTELLPIAGVEGDRAVAMAALDGLLAVLHRIQSLSGRSLPASDWSTELVALAGQALRVAPGDRAARDAWDTLLQQLRALQAETVAAGVDPELHWTVVQDRVLTALDAVPERQPFLLGGATFCGMVPQRAIPFRFIAVLGLDEGEFPRTPNDGGLDLMAKLRRLGDREQRSDDRYLFLETLMSARDRLHLSWIGEGVADGQPRNPAAPLAELMAMLERADAQTDAVTVPLEGGDEDAPPTLAQTRAWRVAHPLQPFDARYFGGDPRLYTFDARQAPLRKIATRDAAANDDGSAAHAARTDSGSPWPARLRLHDLRRYWRDPADDLLERCAGADLAGLSGQVLGGEEPLADRLPAFAGVARRVFLAGDAADAEAPAPDALRLSGQLPSGRAGESAWHHEAGVVAQLREAAKRDGVEIGVPKSIEIELALDIDGHPLVLQGAVQAFVRMDGGLQVVACPVGNKGLKAVNEVGFSQMLPLYLDWLALRLATPVEVPVRVAILCSDAPEPWALALNEWDARLQAGAVSIERVRDRLQRFTGWMLEAPAHPLRWFPHSAQAVVNAAESDRSEKLQQAWLGGFNAGERDRAPGHIALLAGDERFDMDSAASRALIAFALQVQQAIYMDDPPGDAEAGA